MSSTLAPQNPLSYMGVKPPRPPNVIQDDRAPTNLDTNYDIGTIWVFYTMPQVYILAQLVGNNAIWLPINAGSVGVSSLTGNSGGAVPPTAGNINILATDGLTVVGNPGTSTLTIQSSIGQLASNFNVDANTGPGTDPVVPNSSGTVQITGGQAVSGTTANVIRTISLAANQFTIQIQRAAAVAATDAAQNGVAHFNSAQFTVDANGFVGLAGGGQAIDSIGVDNADGPGTNPVLPTMGGLVTITGAQVAAGVVGTNVVRTSSLAASTLTIEIQRSSAQAASTVGSNGVCHFSSVNFTVDANGFVQLAGVAGFVWNEVTLGAANMAANNGYVSNNAGLVTLTLPALAAFGTVIRVAGKGAGGWLIAQNAGQNIQVGNVSSTIGAGGSVASTNQFDAIELLCTTANTTWTAINNPVGALNIT